ncbi:hypothetical protein ACQP3J_29595, partial [Escherichia coli]
SPQTDSKALLLKTTPTQLSKLKLVPTKNPSSSIYEWKGTLKTIEKKKKKTPKLNTNPITEPLIYNLSCLQNMPRQ